MTFLAYMSQYTFVFWFPTMLKRMSGMTDIRVGLWGAVPFLTSFLVMQVNGWHSDKTRERARHAAWPVLVSALGWFLLTLPPQTFPAMIAVFAMAGVITAYLPTFWTIPAEVLPPTELPAAVGMINASGSVAGFVGPYLMGYLQTQTHTPNYGLALTAVASLLAGALILHLRKHA